MRLYEYKDYDIDALPDDVRQALAYWHAVKGERLAPTWADFDLMRIPPKVLPYTNVVDVIDGGADFYVRFYGSSLAEIHGELTGKKVSEADPPELVEAVLKSMREAVTQARPLARIGQIYPRHVVVLQSLIRLPLSDDGETVSHLVSVAQYEHDIHGSKDVVEKTFS